MRGKNILLAALLGLFASAAFPAAQTITPPVVIGPGFSTNTSFTTITLDANGEYWSAVLRAPKTGTIARVHFLAGTVTANGDGLRIRIETVDASTGLPSGTLVGGSSEVTHATTTASTWNRGTSGLNAAVTAGDVIAVKLASPGSGTTFNGVLNVSSGANPTYLPANSNFPYVVNAIPTATKGSVTMSITLALEYDDGTTPFVAGAAPISAFSQPSYNTGSTPDERGNLCSLPFPIRIIGVFGVAFGGASSGVFDIIVYDGSDSTLASVSNDPDINRATGGAAAAVFRFATPVSIAANTSFRVVAKPTSANSIFLTTHSIDTSNGGTRLREAMFGSTPACQLTTRSDAGAWTDTPDTFAHLGIIVDQFDDGTGGGNNVAINPLGGLVH